MSDETARAIDKEIRRIVDESYERARTCLKENRDELETLAQALLEYETLSGDEIKILMDGGSIDRGGKAGPAIPVAGSSIPKAPRKKPRPLGGPAAAGA
jgi:cell division protease FtsH